MRHAFRGDDSTCQKNYRKTHLSFLGKSWTATRIYGDGEEYLSVMASNTNVVVLFVYAAGILVAWHKGMIGF